MSVLEKMFLVLETADWDEDAGTDSPITLVCNVAGVDRLTASSSGKLPSCTVRDDQDILALVNAAKRAIEEITGQASVQASKSTSRVSVLGSLNNQDGS